MFVNILLFLEKLLPVFRSFEQNLRKRLKFYEIFEKLRFLYNLKHLQNIRLMFVKDLSFWRKMLPIFRNFQ